VPDSRADDLRDDLRRLFKGRHRRFHWHKEQARDRMKMMEFIADAQLHSHIVTKALPKLSRQERARAHCLERLLWELKQHDTNNLVVEARQARNNSRDQSTILAAQMTGKAAAEVRYEFGLPTEEPLLWMADAIASAMAASLYSGRDVALERVAL
jgi:hypothetical protein